MAGKTPIHKTKEHDWDACPSGTFRGLSNKLQSRRQRRQFLKTVGALGVLAGTGGVTFWLGSLLLPGQRTLAGLTCAQVHDYAEQFRDRTLAEELRRKVRDHVAHCSVCKAQFEQMGVNL